MSRWLAVLVATGCGAPPAPTVRNVAPPFAMWPAPPIDPIPALVVDAFDGAPPLLPLLSADGTFAAVNLSLDELDYEVGLVMDARVVERFAVVDAQMASHPDGDKRDARIAARRAAVVAKKLAGATPFAHAFNPTGEHIEDLQLVPVGDGAQLRIEATGDLVLTLLDPRGVAIARRELAVASSDPECHGRPIVAGVWLDGPRKRLLVRVHYRILRCLCPELPPSYQLFSLP
jgi:hypothetical protein